MSEPEEVVEINMVTVKHDKNLVTSEVVDCRVGDLKVQLNLTCADAGSGAENRSSTAAMASNCSRKMPKPLV